MRSRPLHDSDKAHSLERATLLQLKPKKGTEGTVLSTIKVHLENFPESMKTFLINLHSKFSISRNHSDGTKYRTVRTLRVLTATKGGSLSLRLNQIKSTFFQG